MKDDKTIMRECDLYPHVRAWLREHGYEIHVEVFDADVVAVRSGTLTAVELKMSSPAELMRQLHVRAMWADYVIGAMPHRPKSTAGFKSYGFGLLVVAGGKVKQVCTPRPQPDGWHRRRAYRVKRLSTRPPAHDHETAGLPACARLKEQRAIRTITKEQTNEH